MGAHYQRAVLLFEQQRYELAEQEVRQELAETPEDSSSYALLALCLAGREQFAEASQAADRAVHLEPDRPFAHYARAKVLWDRNRLDEAEAAAAELLRLEPDDAINYRLLAGIRFDQRRWPEALEAAERGLACDPENVGCINLRAMALVKLGRNAEAGEALTTALARDPDNATSHANQGWTLLHQGQPYQAMEHFREALRLDPELDYARSGIVEAMKARNLVYRLLLAYFLWMGRLSHKAQWGILLGGYFGNRILRGLAKTNPALVPWVLPVSIAYITFAVLTWLAGPLLNLLLRLDRFGRHALSRDEIQTSNLIGLCLLSALLFLVAWGLTGAEPFAMGALVCGLLAIPVAGTFKCDPGWPRNVMGAVTALLGVAGLVGVGLGITGWFFVAGDDARSALALSGKLLSVCLLGIIVAQFLANGLAAVTVKR